jgi:hypothetical protein
MPRRHPKGPDILRGRHRKHWSAETKHWHNDHLVPTKPAWMTADEYARLLKIRGH